MIFANQFNQLYSLINLEMSNNQLTSFCLRLMNKGLYKEQEKLTFLATIIWNLEKITDEYKTICINLSSNNMNMQKDILEIYKNVNELFYSYYELIYRFYPEKLNELITKKEEIISKMNNVNPKTRHEARLLNTLWTITSKTSDLSSSICALHYA